MRGISRIVVVGVLLLMARPVLAQQPIVFKLAFTDPPYMKIGELQVMHHSTAGMVAFKATVENLTQKRVVVENYYHGRLGDANENLRQIIAGTLQGATPADGAVAPFYAGIQVFAIPYLFKDPLAAYNLWDGPVGQAVLERAVDAHLSLSGETGAHIEGGVRLAHAGIGLEHGDFPGRDVGLPNK